MRLFIALSLLGLTACVDPLPVGGGGAFGPVLGTAPREATGPGPFLTGGTGDTPGAGGGATGIGTAAVDNDPRGEPGFTRVGLDPNTVYVGGQEGVVIAVNDYDEARQRGLSAETLYGSIVVREGCGSWVDIFGRQYRNPCG